MRDEIVTAVMERSAAERLRIEDTHTLPLDDLRVLWIDHQVGRRRVKIYDGSECREAGGALLVTVPMGKARSSCAAAVRNRSHAVHSVPPSR